MKKKFLLKAAVAISTVVLTALSSVSMLDAFAFQKWYGSDGEGRIITEFTDERVKTDTSGYWRVFDDHEAGGESYIEWPNGITSLNNAEDVDTIVEEKGGIGGTFHMKKSAASESYVGVLFDLVGKAEDGSTIPVDLTRDYIGIRITYTSDAATSFQICPTEETAETIGYDLPSYALPKAATENNKEILWSSFKQTGWGEAKMSGSAVASQAASFRFMIQTADGTEGDFCITSIELWKCEHHLSSRSKIDSTCTYEGCEAFYECSYCNKLFRDPYGEEEISEPIAIPKHHFVDESGEPAGVCRDCKICKSAFENQGAHNYVNKTTGAYQSACVECGAENENKCGLTDTDNVYYVIDDDKMLHIYGSGKMTDTAPWSEKKGTIESVVIESGVTSIGSSAFSGMGNLTAVTIGDCVTTIGTSAFEDCSKLKEVEIPSSVTKIENEAFKGCSNMNLIIFREATLPSMGTNVFQGISSPVTVVTPAEKCVEYQNTLSANNIIKFEEGTKCVKQIEGDATLSGTAKIGQTLTAVCETKSNADQYVWYRDEKRISGQESSSYTLTAEDYHHKIKVKIYYTSDSNEGGYLSAETGLVAGFKVSFNTNGGDTLGAVEDVAFIPTDLPTPTKSAFYFQGWYTDAQFTTKVTSEAAINQDTTLYAKWICNNLAKYGRHLFQKKEILQDGSERYGYGPTCACGIKDISENNTELQIEAESVIFDGTEKTAKITGIDESNYDVVDRSNKATNVCDYTIELVGKNEYSGTRYVSWSIEPPFSIENETESIDPIPYGTDQTLTVEVNAKEGQVIHYQWYLNNTKLQGATSSTFSTKEVPLDTDSIQCEVSNENGKYTEYKVIWLSVFHECKSCKESEMKLLEKSNCIFYEGYYYIPSGSYVLPRDIDLSTWGADLAIIDGQSVDLCLNGYDLKGTGNNSVIKVGLNSTLNLYDCVGTGTITNGKGLASGGYRMGGAIVNLGTVNFYEGTIAGNSADIGGAIYSLNDTAIVNLKGGNIRDCAATLFGGAIYCQGTVNMETGSIEDCTATAGGAIYSMNDKAVVNLKGGAIRGCSVTHFGGAICNKGTINMEDGIIENCTATDSADGLGAAICNQYLFNMKGGIIRNCTSSYVGGAVFSDGHEDLGGKNLDTIFTMSGGEIVNCISACHSECYDSVYIRNSSMRMTGGKIENMIFPNDNTSEGHPVCDISITGGMVSEKPKDTMVAVGYKVAENTESSTKELYPFKIALDEKHDFVKEDGSCDTTKAQCEVCKKKNIAYTGVEVIVTKNPSDEGTQISKPTVALKSGAVTLESGTDYAVNFVEVVDADKKVMGYTITITGEGLYAGKRIETWFPNKVAPTKADVTVTAPANLTYDGKEKVATASPSSRATNLGEISKVYYRRKGETQMTEKAPVNAGTYTVLVDIEDSQSYFGGTTLPLEVGEFTIAQAKPVLGKDYTVPTSLEADCGSSLSATFLSDGFVWTDADCVLSAEVNQSSTKITKEAKFVPKDTTNYEVVENIALEITVKHQADAVQLEGQDKHRVTCANKACAYVGEEEACSGGKATCSSKAICSVCQSAYGETDLDAHDYKDGICQSCKKAQAVTKNGLTYTVVTEEKQVEEGKTEIVAKVVTTKDSEGNDVESIAVSVRAATSEELSKAQESAVSGAVAIPAVVNADNTRLVVTKIEENAFKDTAATAISTPETVESVGEGAFASETITEVTFSSSVAPSIDENAFVGSKVTVVTVPEGATGYAQQEAFKSETIEVKENQAGSNNPSVSDNDVPSQNPSVSDNDVPSAAPGEEPSAVPSGTPGDVPSTSPSAAASEQPSAGASQAPSQTPSQTPSAAAGTQPSAGASQTPSQIPSGQPSVTPSQEPKKGDVIKDTKSGEKLKLVNPSKKEVSYEAIPTSQKKKTSIKISSTIKINGETYKVTEIGDNAFKGNTKVTSISLPSTIKKIGKNAFRSCTKLKKITIPKNVTEIGSNVFYGCKNLKSITVTTTKLTSKNVTKSTFKGLSKNTVIYVPKKKLSSYSKLFKGKGFKGTVKAK